MMLQIHNQSYYDHRYIVTIWEKHSKKIWDNWNAHLFADTTLLSASKQLLATSFRDFFSAFDSACEPLVKNDLTEFYNIMTDKFLHSQQYVLNPHVISRGLIFFEKSISPFLTRVDDETRIAVLQFCQDIAIQLNAILNECSKKWILSSRLLEEDIASTMSALDDILPKGTLVELQNGNGSRMFQFLQEYFLLKNHNILLQDKVMAFQIIAEFDEHLIAHSGIEAVISGLQFCVAKLQLSRVALFGYSPCSDTVEGILGINVDQERIQCVRETVSKIPFFKETFVTQSPVCVMATDKPNAATRFYVNVIGFACPLIVPMVNQRTVYGWLALEQDGGAVPSRFVLDVVSVIGSRIALFLSKNKEASHPIAEVRLTNREMDILKLLAEGYENKMIGDILHISEHTVRDYVSGLMIKLAAKNRAQVVSAGFRNGLLT